MKETDIFVLRSVLEYLFNRDVKLHMKFFRTKKVKEEMQHIDNLQAKLSEIYARVTNERNSKLHSAVKRRNSRPKKRTKNSKVKNKNV